MLTGNVVPVNAGTLIVGPLAASATVVLKVGGGQVGISDTQQNYGAGGNPLSTAVFNVNSGITTFRMAQGEELWACQPAAASVQVDWLVTYEE